MFTYADSSDLKAQIPIVVDAIRARHLPATQDAVYAATVVGTYALRQTIGQPGEPLVVGDIPGEAVLVMPNEVDAAAALEAIAEGYNENPNNLAKGLPVPWGLIARLVFKLLTGI